MTTRYLILQGKLNSLFKDGKEKQERLFHHFFFSNVAAHRFEQSSADWGIKVWTLSEQTALREERGVLFLFQGGNMIYMPLTIKVSVLLEQVFAISLQHCLQGHCPFSFSLQCIVYKIGMYIPLLHIADMDRLTHFMCLDYWAHFVCVLFFSHLFHSLWFSQPRSVIYPAKSSKVGKRPGLIFSTLLHRMVNITTQGFIPPYL